MNYQKFIRICLILCAVLGVLIVFLPHIIVVSNGETTWKSSYTYCTSGDTPPAILLETAVPFVVMLLLPFIAMVTQSFKGRLLALVLLVIALAYVFIVFYFAYSLGTLYIRKQGYVGVYAGPALYLPLAEIVVVVVALSALLVLRRKELTNA